MYPKRFRQTMAIAYNRLRERLTDMNNYRIIRCYSFALKCQLFQRPSVTKANWIPFAIVARLTKPTTSSENNLQPFELAQARATKNQTQKWMIGAMQPKCNVIITVSIARFKESTLECLVWPRERERDALFIWPADTRWNSNSKVNFTR